MSWDAYERTEPCACGLGTVIFRSMDNDWYQYEDSREIRCPKCVADEALKRKKEEEEDRRRRECREKALQLAEERYLNQWLARFDGCKIKQAWELYAAGSHYPWSQRTFYKHVRERGGVDKYMRSRFELEFDKIMGRMNIHDDEIAALLREEAVIAGSLRSYDPSRRPHWGDDPM